MRRILLLLVPFLLVAATFGPWEFEDTQQPVEQQTPGGATQPDHSLWVTNPTMCAWDADDSRSTGFVGGVLPAGETVTASKCVIVDGMPHAVWFNVLARSSSLIVETRFDPQGYVFQATAVSKARGYEYWTCSLGPEYDNSAVPSLPEITGSNGGRGEYSTVTVRITNPTNRAVHKVSAVMRLRPFLDEASGGRCFYEDLPPRVGTYPGPFITWKTS